MAQIIINLNKTTQNFIAAKTLCEKCSVELALVTKCCGGDPVIINHLVKNGAFLLADSHPFHFRCIEDSTAQVTRVGLVTRLSDLKKYFPYEFVYVTELTFLKRLAESTISYPAEIIIPIEIGDRREGVERSQIVPFMKSALRINNVHIAGFSANYGCFVPMAPDLEKIGLFIKTVKQIQVATGFEPTVLSVGGTSLWSLLEKNNMPEEITQIRIGEGVFLGAETGLKIKIAGLHHDTFILQGEIIEIKEKKYSCFGLKNYTETVSKNIKNRTIAIVDIGYTTCPHTGLSPIHRGIKIIGSTQDHTILDVTDASIEYFPGDSVSFLMNYNALATAMINPYIQKQYQRDN